MLWLRTEVFGAALPHEAAAACSLEPSLSSPSSLAQLRVEDVFAVVDELRRHGNGQGGLTTYSTWLSTAWHVLEWPEPSARLFWEMVWLLGDDDDDQERSREEEEPSAARRALSRRIPVSDFACFLLIHCRHDPESSQDFSFFEEAWIDRSRHDDSDSESVESSHHGGGSSPEKTPPASPPTSPRSRRGAKRASLDLCLRARGHAEATRLEWFSARLETLLDLISNRERDDDDDDTVAFDGEEEREIKINRREFDRLSFLIRTGSRRLLGDLCPLFVQRDDSRVSAKSLAAWLTSQLRRGSPLFAGRKMFGGERSLGQSRSFKTNAASALLDGSVSIVDARKCTRIVVDDDTSTTPLFDCRVVGCRDVRAYVLCAADCVDVVGCVDCLVVVGAVSRVVRLIACERTHLVVAAGRAIVSSCLTCRLSLYSPFSPLLDGDNRSCHVAPHCAVYDGIRRHLAKAGLILDSEREDDATTPPNLWRSCLRLSAALNRGSNFAVSLPSTSLALPPADFQIVAIPFAKNETVLPFPLPPEYSAVLEARRERAQLVKRRIENLSAPDRAKVQAASNAAFAKWLVDTRRQRHVLELAQIDDDDDDDAEQDETERSRREEGAVSSATSREDP